MDFSRFRIRSREASSGAKFGFTDAARAPTPKASLSRGLGRSAERPPALKYCSGARALPTLSMVGQTTRNLWDHRLQRRCCGRHLDNRGARRGSQPICGRA